MADRIQPSREAQAAPEPLMIEDTPATVTLDIAPDDS
jgi:hypothetical protein